MPLVSVFFYGSFISCDVLAEHDVIVDRYEVARLYGYDMVIQPLANLVRVLGRSVYGILAEVTEQQLDRIYGEVWVSAYPPDDVTVETLASAKRSARCYLAPASDPSPPARDYIDRIVQAAQRYAFPEWYLQRLELYRT